MSVKVNIPKGNILTIDIGGSNLKACVLNESGKIITDYIKTPTPKKSTPENVLDAIVKLVKDLKDFEKIAVGFPGYVRNGYVMTAPNLAKDKWAEVNLAQNIANAFKKPVRLVNDADLQGLGIVKGKGLEIVWTLGTGFGTALYFDGEMLPHFELSHLPVGKEGDYDDYIGDIAFDEIGKKDWNKRLKKIISTYKTVFNYDKLYIGGGNANEINFEVDENIKLVSNKDGIKGGAKLWKAKEKYLVCTIFPTKK